MNRRETIFASLALSLLTRRAQAQQPLKVFRLGCLSHYIPREKFTLLPAALRQLGYEEGRNVLFNYKFAEGRAERLPLLASELVAAKVDLIIASVNPEIQAAKQATSLIPIVMVYGLAPVESGLVASLARPGGNVTGTTVDDPAGAGKKLEILREVVPGAKRITLIWEPEFPGMDAYIREAQRAATTLGIRLTLLPGRTLAELEAAFNLMDTDRPDALYVVPTGVLFNNRARVIEYAARQRLPAMYINKGSVAEGGLMAYLPDPNALLPRTAATIDRILKGAKPSEIPVEQPTKYQLVFNLKTARELGITLSPSLRTQVDEFIQ
jgi:putative ABC transport system substrate-binding protein